MSISSFVKDTIAKREKVRVIGFGDSITQGNEETYGAWPQELQSKLNSFKDGVFETVNKGKNGNTTANGFDRIEADIIPNLPAVVIIEFGINDSNNRAWSKVPRVSVSEYEKNLREFHRVITSNGGHCIFIVNHILEPLENSRFHNQGNGKKYQENLDKYNEVVRKLALELGVPTIDFPEHIAKNSLEVQSLLIEDGVHLSRKGYDVYIDYIFERFKEIVGDI